MKVLRCILLLALLLNARVMFSTSVVNQKDSIRISLLKIADGHDVRYGIRTHTRPTDAEIQEIFEAINLSLKNGRDGKVGITEADSVRLS